MNQKLLDKKYKDLISTAISLKHDDLATFLEKEKDCFFDSGILVEPYRDGGKEIPRGTKIIKDFKYFITDEDELRYLQDRASRIIQDKKINGTLCLSIHPLDYLSVSCNAHGWRSCHSLDGEYRAGNLAYMADSSTLVAYLKADNDTGIEFFPSSVPWNSKKWRTLIFVSESKDMMFAGRQYPFDLGVDILNKVSELFEVHPIFHLNTWTMWENSCISSFPSCDGTTVGLDPLYLLGAKRQLVPLTELVPQSKHGTLFFNDLLYSHSYTEPYYRYKRADWSGWPKAWEKIHNERFEIGTTHVRCISCGGGLIDHGTEAMLCTACHNERFAVCHCANCGSPLQEDDIFYVGDECWCEDCYNTDTRDCSSCEILIPEANGYWHEDKFYCVNCYDERTGR